MKKPNGLRLIEDFVSVDREQLLIDEINQQPWDTTLARRTQHYGIKYDYANADLGGEAPPMPPKMSALAERLATREIFDEAPQVALVNEYLVGPNGPQGIAAHVDHPTAWGPVVVSISLLESWSMQFDHAKHGRVELLLPRRSALVLTGPARYEWRHGIAKRKFDKYLGEKIRRQRRVSITFRTNR